MEQYLPVRKSSYGEPDGALLEDNQKVVGAITRGMIDLLGKSANGQTGMRKDMLDATNRRKFEKGLDYEFNPNVDPRSRRVHAHLPGDPGQSAQFMLQLQTDGGRVDDRGEVLEPGHCLGPGLGDVAAGIRGALDASSKRELGILRRLSNGLIKIGPQVHLHERGVPGREVIRITDEEFVPVKPR
jgi:hypothetical protein